MPDDIVISAEEAERRALEREAALRDEALAAPGVRDRMERRNAELRSLGIPIPERKAK